MTKNSLADEPIWQRDGGRDCQDRENIVAIGISPDRPGATSAMLRQVVEASLSGICIVDQRGRIAFANRALLADWGYDLWDLVGKPVDLLWLSRRGGSDCIDGALSTGEWIGSMIARRKDSSLFDARVSVSTVHDTESSDTWLLFSCLDVTAQRKEEGAPGHHRSLEMAIAAMPARFMDPARIDLAIDDSLEDLGLAYRACRTYLSFFSDTRTLLGTTHEWCMPGKKSHRGEFQKFLTSDLPWWIVQILEGETVLMYGEPGAGRSPGRGREFLERHGISAALMIPLHLKARVVGFIGFDRDTGDRFSDEDVALLHAAVHIIAGGLERKQSEYLFRESENLYQIVLDAITDAVTVVDTNLTLLLVNDAFTDWCEELGLETIVAGKNLFSVIPFLPPTIRQQYERVMRTGRPLSYEWSLKVGDRIMTLREMRIPILERGEVARIVTVIRDITAQKEVEDLRSKAYAQIDRNMEQFALLADHIRNPLQVIMGHAELLDDAAITKKILEQVQRINMVIDQLDERWAESRKLSMFWRRYS
ncbi:MAG: PAS domain S-box protein [Methanomicrobiales archaeon]|nr:PAS domain S-box protein [Methanomicrobiales archaeon]